MSEKVRIRRLPTGVPGLDAVLGGGVPEFSFNVIAGTAGAGKTTLAPQIMSSVQHLGDDLIGFVHAQDKDLRGHGASDLARGLQAIQLRHADVEHYDVGLQVDGLGHCFAPRARFATDDPSRLPFQQRAHALTHDVMVVGDEDADAVHGAPPSIGTRTRTVVPVSANSRSKIPPS
jgi:hypothetical protein